MFFVICKRFLKNIPYLKGGIVMTLNYTFSVISKALVIIHFTKISKMISWFEVFLSYTKETTNLSGIYLSILSLTSRFLNLWIFSLLTYKVIYS